MTGLSLSAFFSGSETGMYRVPRVRLVLDALDGKWIPRGLVWLLNNPTLLVATALAGNNMSHYLASLSIVLGVGLLWTDGGTAAEMIGTMILTPVLFVLGELLPKYLFFNAPYRLIRITGGPLLLVTYLMLPITLFIGLLGKLLSILTGETPFQVQVGMAQRELQQVFQEGHQAGLLGDSQRAVAQNLWSVGGRPALAFGVPPDRFPVVRRGADTKSALTEARRQAHPVVLLRSRRGEAIEGYFLYSDLLQKHIDMLSCLRTIVRLPADQRHLEVLMRLYESNSEVAVLVDRSGAVEAVVTRRQLIEPLLADH